MSTTANQPAESSVRRSIVVQAGIDKAFRVFTEECDSWWPRTHHIGKSPMKKIVIEGRQGGCCYTVQVDDTRCEWGTVLVWEPPRRFVMAWQITHEWGYEPDIHKASEVEVRFTPTNEGMTQVDLEHRHFDRHGAGGDMMRTAVDAPEGWNGLLRLYKDQADKGN
jgi:hypothetical protein